MRELTEMEKRWYYNSSVCAFCQGRLFFEGPHGGLSINWFCTDCGQGVNLSPEPLRSAQLIGKLGENWSPAPDMAAKALRIDVAPTEVRDGHEIIQVEVDVEKFVADAPQVDATLDAVHAMTRWIEEAIPLLIQAGRDRSMLEELVEVAHRACAQLREDGRIRLAEELSEVLERT